MHLRVESFLMDERSEPRVRKIEREEKLVPSRFAVRDDRSDPAPASAARGGRAGRKSMKYPALVNTSVPFSTLSVSAIRMPWPMYSSSPVEPENRFVEWMTCGKPLFRA